MEKHYHTSDWTSYEMLQSANALRSLAIADSGQSKKDPLLFLIPSILMAYTAIQTRVNEAVEEYLQKHKASFPVNYVRKVAKQAPLDTKLVILTTYLTGRTFPRDTGLWNDFVVLQRLRNHLVHYELKQPEDEEWKGIFYQDIVHEQVNPDEAKKAVETAKAMMNNLNALYFDNQGDYYDNIKT